MRRESRTAAHRARASAHHMHKMNTAPARGSEELIDRRARTWAEREQIRGLLGGRSMRPPSLFCRVDLALARICHVDLSDVPRHDGSTYSEPSLSESISSHRPAARSLRSAAHARRARRRDASPVAGNMIALRRVAAHGLRSRMPSRAGVISLARFPACGSLAGRLRNGVSRRRRALDLPVERADGRRLARPRAGCSHRATFFLAFWLMISGWAPADLPVGLAAVAGATWTSLRFLPPRGSRIRLALSGVACGELFAPVGCFGRGRRLAGAQSEVATAARIRGLPIAFAPRRRAKRILRALEPDAGDAADRDRRKRGAAGSLPRHRPAGCGQSGGGRAPVHPGGRR